jgi:hypothetical protein
MSGEIHKDVADTFRKARNDVEMLVNSTLTRGDFGRGVEKWALIAIILPPGWGDGSPEVVQYHRKRRVAEFRLVIDFEKFKCADEVGHKGLIGEMLLRSVALMEEMSIPGFDLNSFRLEVRRVAEGQGWLKAVGEPGG